MKKPEVDFSFSRREEGFDNHISQSIRGYDQLHTSVVSMSKYFVENDSTVVDIGSSTGKTIRAMVAQNEEFAPTALYIGIEPAAGFVGDMTKTVNDIKASGHVEIDYFKEDIRECYFPHNCSYVTSLFTLQFMSKKDRISVLETVYDRLNVGGAFVFAEKVFSSNPQMQDMFTFLYYDYKRQNFTDKDILDKEAELRSMLKPSTWDEITEQLSSVGFNSVDMFWKNYNFLGGIAIK